MFNSINLKFNLMATSNQEFKRLLEDAAGEEKPTKNANDNLMFTGGITTQGLNFNLSKQLHFNSFRVEEFGQVRGLDDFGALKKRVRDDALLFYIVSSISGS